MSAALHEQGSRQEIAATLSHRGADVPVTGPPRYVAGAMRSTRHPNLLSQALARSASPVPAPPNPLVSPATSGSLEYACATLVGSESEPPDWYEKALYDEGSLRISLAQRSLTKLRWDVNVTT